MATEYINDETVVKEAKRRLQKHLPIKWSGNTYGAEDAWTVLIGSSAMRSSLAAICREARDAPSGNTLREKLNEQGWKDADVEAACNQLLAESCSGCRWPGRYRVVIDLHEEPFYGEIPEDDGDVIRRGAAKSGTTHFHVFATAYVIRNNRPFTLALTRVRAHESMLSVANRMKERVEDLGIKVDCFLLDRQFWCYELLSAWRSVPYIIPVRRTGKKGSGGGTRPLFDLKKNQFVSHTMTCGKLEPLETKVAVVVLRETKKERRDRIAKAEAAREKAQATVARKTKEVQQNPAPGTKRSLSCATKALAKALENLKKERSLRLTTTLCYAVNVPESWSLKRIYKAYSRRFGIESSYRQGRQARMTTSSRKTWFRLLRFGITVALRNLWIEVRWFLGEPKQGRSGRKIAKSLFPFPEFLRWIDSAVRKAVRLRTALLPQTALPCPLWAIS